MRIEKYIADVTEFSRNDVKKLIREKRITVNDQLIRSGSVQVDETSVVKIDGEIVEYAEYEYLILNKPSGYITALEDNRYPVVMELITSLRSDLVPVGRLDLDTEGLLLITNNGQLNHQLLAKNNHVAKKYYVKTDICIPNDAKERFLQPMKFEDFVSLPAEYESITDHSGYLTITQGKYHQVKRMFEKLGCTVTYLKRVSFGPLTLGDLKIGESRPLTQEEIDSLLTIA